MYIIREIQTIIHPAVTKDYKKPYISETTYVSVKCLIFT